MSIEVVAGKREASGTDMICQVRTALPQLPRAILPPSSKPPRKRTRAATAFAAKTREEVEVFFRKGRSMRMRSGANRQGKKEDTVARLRQARLRADLPAKSKRALVQW